MVLLAVICARTIVMHVGVASTDLSVARVKGRHNEGGHDVPEDKIRARHDRGQPLIRDAVLRATRGMVYDNSKLNEPARRVLVFSGERLMEVDPHLPDWVVSVYREITLSPEQCLSRTVLGCRLVSQDDPCDCVPQRQRARPIPVTRHQ